MIAAQRHQLSSRSWIIGAIVVSWGLAIVAEVSGQGQRLHHDWLIGGGLPWGAASAVFLLAWQVMIAAMMLPSALPLIALYARLGFDQPRAGLARAAFLAGYSGIWTLFGALAFVGDGIVHRVVHETPWLESRPWLISGSVLVLAGVFQFSDLKERCLKECRMPAQFLMKHYRRGVGAGFRIGVQHGMSCLGCCWALMLVGFAAGVANLWWMSALTAVMVIEKTARWGHRVVAPVGVLLVISGLGVVAIQVFSSTLF